MKLKGRLCALSVLMGLSACTDWDERFPRECKKVANVKVHDANAWNKYLRQTKAESLGNGDRTVLAFVTPDFVVRTQWYEQGRPKWSKEVLYENDYLVRIKRTNRLVATISNLSLTTNGFGSSASWTCIDNHPELYERHYRSGQNF